VGAWRLPVGADETGERAFRAEALSRLIGSAKDYAGTSPRLRSSGSTFGARPRKAA
jgi:hypothetical protein